MDEKYIPYIKQLALVAMFSDDSLMQMLVLKGGNAIDLVYKMDARSSLDLDFSTDSSFEETGLELIKGKIEIAISKTFSEAGYKIFDFNFAVRPPKPSKDVRDFWGGYLVEFKLIQNDRFKLFENDWDNLRKNALPIDNRLHKKFSIDISKGEYCNSKEKAEIDGYTIFVYTPAMLAIEKLRAICQQMKEYHEFIPNPSQSARARDFYDIYVVVEGFSLDLSTAGNAILFKKIFEAKKVPLNFLGLLGNYREYHRVDFSSVQQTVKPNVKLKDYDFYFDYVLALVKDLKPFWNK
jgi:hypothetical protein